MFAGAFFYPWELTARGAAELAALPLYNSGRPHQALGYKGPLTYSPRCWRTHSSVLGSSSHQCIAIAR